MARKLVVAYSRRRKVFRRGHLHVPRTLRRNMKYDDAIVELQWKAVKTDQPSPYCHQVDECGTLTQLERVVSRLLLSHR